MKKISAQLFLLYFLFITGYAFAYTMVRVEFLPFVPWVVLRYHYGMMAPYQGINAFNVDLLAEGLRNNEWRTIDLDSYYPMILGNKIMYRRMRSFSFLGVKAHGKKYAELAQKLLTLEKEKGSAYESLRLTWQEWPKSPLGWDVERKEGQITNYPILTIP